jgi:hypothetical protein
MMGGGVQGTPQIQPIMVDGEEHYVLCMTPWDEYNLRTGTSAGQWLDIQKALATASARLADLQGRPRHVQQRRAAQPQVGDPLQRLRRRRQRAASRSLFLGEQAAVCAFGSPGTGLRFDWAEETATTAIRS